MHPIGERVRQARRLVEGLTAAELSSLIGVSAGYIALLEAGTRSNPGSDIVTRLARVLGCSAGWLLTGEGQAPEAPEVRVAVARAREAHRGPAAA